MIVRTVDLANKKVVFVFHETHDVLGLLSFYLSDPALMSVVKLLLQLRHCPVKRAACFCLLENESPMVHTLVDHCLAQRPWIYIERFQSMEDLLKSGMYSFLSSLYYNQMYQL